MPTPSWSPVSAYAMFHNHVDHEDVVNVGELGVLPRYIAGLWV